MLAKTKKKEKGRWGGREGTEGRREGGRTKFEYYPKGMLDFCLN